MFGKDEELEKIKSALAATDSDMGAFRDWQKKYEKLNRQWQTVKAQYESALADTEWIRDAAGQLERMITGEAAYDKKAFAQILKDMKRRQNGFDHEFLISEEDHDFHSIYDTIVRLGQKAYEVQDQRIILQSEIENLLALVKEALDKKRPSTWKLAFYLMEHSAKDLIDLPASGKLASVNQTYEEHFMKPIVNLLMGAIERADRRREECRNSSDRRSRKFLEATEVLLADAGQEDVRKRAEQIISRIAESR